MKVTAHRGALLHFVADPSEKGLEGSCEHFPDGLLVVQDGLVRACGPSAQLLKKLPRGVKVVRHEGSLLLPGFVDCHVHFAQLPVIASHGGELLDWLERCVFPAEARLRSPSYARQTAKVFLREMLRHGTTTALVFATTHAASVEALFEEARRLRLRLIAGKTLMDRNAPKELFDGAGGGEAETRRLIARWHGRGRLEYAVTPRFAPTSTDGQLEMAGRLLKEHPGVRLHTHLSESQSELAWVAKLFPEAKDYLDVYDRAGLVGPRSVFAHGVHLSDDEWRRLAAARSAVAFCPTSNLFLGSGLFDLRKAGAFRVETGLGTDVGAGTSLSLLQTLNEAYKVARLRGQNLPPLMAFYMATLGGARALGLSQKIGSFLPGREADFVVLDPQATPLLRYRLRQVRGLPETLFALMTLGDDRAVKETYVLGSRVHRRDA